MAVCTVFFTDLSKLRLLMVDPFWLLPQQPLKMTLAIKVAKINQLKLIKQSTCYPDLLIKIGEKDCRNCWFHLLIFSIVSLQPL
jgi:hypothetical protein